MNSFCNFPIHLTTALLLVACQSHRLDIHPRTVESAAPPNWSSTHGQTIPSSWIQSLQSPTLVELANEAEENNFGLESAYQRTRAAASVARISKSLRLPSINASLNSRTGETMGSFSPPIAVDSESHTLGLSARWEIDLWNRLGLEKSSAQAEYQASQFDFQSLRLSLASQVARSWFSAIEAKQQYELASASADSVETNLETLEKRYSRGLADAFDLRLTRAQAASGRATALSRRQQMDASVRLLETLLGRYPSAELQTNTELPTLSPTPSAGLPATLLERRPDLLAQKSRLVSALSLEAAARKNWLPTLSITASDGTLSSSFSELLDSDFNVWSIVGDASMAIFQGGRLAAQREQLNANQMSQLANYNELVLQAFREVETALRSETDLAELEEQSQISAHENRLAEQQAWELYERGLVDISAVLDAERRSFDARSQLISIQNQRLQNRITLHVALGGDL